MRMGMLKFIFILSFVASRAVASYCPVRDDSLLERGRKCRKECTTDADCNAENKGCYCDGVCGLSCLNKMSECPEPAGIENGRVNRNHIRWSGVAYYYCNEPFVLIGPKTRKCNADKKWGGLPPACELGCSRPTDVPSSFPSDDDRFTFGGSYNFSCNSGYYMTGNPTRTCRHDGWSEAAFSCRPVRCDQLSDVLNGDIKRTNGDMFGSIASVQCRDGYRSSSPGQTKRCFPGEDGSAYGEWRGSLPSCNLITCGKPVPPTHGSIRDLNLVVLEYKAEIIYECDLGYRIWGPTSVRCGEDGEWGDMPSCIEDFNCDFSDSFCLYTNIGWRKVKSSTGDRGYVVKSEPHRNTFLIGRKPPIHWNGMCLTFRYKLPTTGSSSSDVLTVGGASNEKTYWRVHEDEQVGHWIDGAVNLVEARQPIFQFKAAIANVSLDDIVAFPGNCPDHCHNVTCSNGGTCVNRISSFTCFCAGGFGGRQCETETTCRTPFVSENARLLNPKSRWLYRDQARYECKSGYVSWDPDTLGRMPTSLTCQNNGRWSDTPPRCIKPLCTFSPRLSNPPSVTVPRARYSIGENVRLICGKGFQIRGHSNLTCIGMLEWDKTIPVCERISCDTVPRILHATKTVTPTLRFQQSEVYFDCTNGYYREGSATVTCRFDGSLSRLPVCKRIHDCRNTLPSISHGRKIFEGRITRFECNPMHNLVGRREVSCLNDGTWEHSAPHCKEIKPSKILVYDHIEYLIYMEPSLKSSYSEAKSKCAALNGNIPILYDRWVTSRLRRALDPISRHRDKLFIGLKGEGGREFEWDRQDIRTYRLGEDGGWRKTSGYRKWQNGAHVRPSGNDCIVIQRRKEFDKHRFGWTNAACSERNHFICQRDFDICTPNPCMNSGSCYNVEGETRCDCAFGYTGQYCATEILCDTNELASEVIVYHRPRKLGVNAEIVIGCQEGSRLIGRERITCGRDGRWSPSTTRCQEVTCRTPRLSQNVLLRDVKTSYSVGSQIVFICPEDYIIHGEASAICKLNGDWTDITVTCTAAKCVEPLLPDLAYVEGNPTAFLSGTTITLACLSGRSLQGDPEWRCVDGEWQRTNAKCVVQFCKVDPFLLNLDIEIEGHEIDEIMDKNFVIGDVLTLKCTDPDITPTHSDWHVIGSKITCGARGRWSPRYGGFSCV